MAKKIRFPLEMADGAQVRDLDELKEHFDLEAVIAYYKNGKLLTWLRDRYFEDEAGLVEALDKHAPDFQKKLCEIFGAEFAGGAVDLEELERRQERLEKLRTFTDEEEFIDHIDQVAFDQEELAELLDERADKIYLCGKRFVIPTQCKNVTYIGINRPNVHISGLKAGKQLPKEIELKQIALENPPTDPVGIADRISLSKALTIQLYFKDPIVVDGVRYDHVPVLSAELYDQLDICKGDRIRVHRVGDVIPTITIEERKESGKKIELPHKCPFCNMEMIREAKKLKCTNANQGLKH